MPSPRFVQMQRNLSALRREMLPRTFDPLDNYSDRVRARAAGYRLLAHAEIESFLEDICQNVAIKAMQIWDKERRPSPVLIGLLAFAERSVEGPPLALSSPNPNQHDAWQKKIDISLKLKNALDIYVYVIRNNHGLKEANLLSLLLPLGIEISKLDQTWLADMDSFGANRGTVAHTSIIRPSINPANEYESVKRLLPPLRNIDKDLFAL